MEHALLIRDIAINFYKRYETIALFIIKFIIGLFIFNVINSIGHPMPQVAPFFMPPYGLPLVLLLSVLFAICPLPVGYGLIVVNIGLQISASAGIAFFLMLFLMCIAFFYVRIAPEESALILGIYFAFWFRVPYVVPIIAGLYFGLTSIVPIAIGVFLWYFTPLAAELVQLSSGEEISLIELPTTFSSVYTSVFDGIRGNESWIFTAFIFAMVVLVVYIISRASIDYAKQIAIGVGAAVSALSFILAALVANIAISIFSMLFFTLISAIIVLIVNFFDIVLDYQRAERVQFEDESNYYVVKVIPKVMVPRRERVVRQITQQDYNEWDDDSLLAQEDDAPPYYDTRRRPGEGRQPVDGRGRRK